MNQDQFFGLSQIFSGVHGVARSVSSAINAGARDLWEFEGKFLVRKARETSGFLKNSFEAALVSGFAYYGINAIGEGLYLYGGFDKLSIIEMAAAGTAIVALGFQMELFGRRPLNSFSYSTFVTQQIPESVEKFLNRVALWGKNKTAMAFIIAAGVAYTLVGTGLDGFLNDAFSGNIDFSDFDFIDYLNEYVSMLELGGGVAMTASGIAKMHNDKEAPKLYIVSGLLILAHTLNEFSQTGYFDEYKAAAASLFIAAGAAMFPMRDNHHAPQYGESNELDRATEEMQRELDGEPKNRPSPDA